MNPEEKDFQIETKPPLNETLILKKTETQESGVELLTVEEYESRKASITKKVFEIADRIKNIKQQLQEARNSLNLNQESVEVPPSVADLEKKEQELRQEQIKASANYPGDWTLLLKGRMLDPLTKQKFVETRKSVMWSMKPGEIPPKPTDGITLNKEQAYQAYYQRQIDEYDANVEQVFDKTSIGESSEYGKEPYNVGKGEYGFEGVVFSDAQKSGGEPLSVREKNIIEAHEKGHGLRNFVSDDQRDFTQSIDLEVIRTKDAETGVRQIGYLRQAEEIAERMAQLKNYFGFKAGDIFTKEHLEYAKKHYLKDIGLDNNMTTFFEAVTDFTIDKFVETINKYPL